MAIPAINILGNPNVTEGNFQIAIEDLRKSVIGSGKAYDSANTYSQYDTCVYNGVEYYSKINSNTGNTPTIGTNWGLVSDLVKLVASPTADALAKIQADGTIKNSSVIEDASGRLLVGTTTAGAASQNGVSINNISDSTYISTNHSNGTGTTAWYHNFSYNGTQIGSIYQSGTTAVVYATTSDYRLKENIRPADCKRFMDIKFVDYERIDGRHECGVIAHELQEIYPDLVTGEKDATEIRKVEVSPAIEEVKDEEGNIIVEAVEAVYEEQEFPIYQQVNYMGLIARCGTVIQKQQKVIDDLLKRVEILESK